MNSSANRPPHLAHQLSYHQSPSANISSAHLQRGSFTSASTSMPSDHHAHPAPPAMATPAAPRPEIARAIQAVRTAVDNVPLRLRQGHDPRLIYHDVQVAIARLASASGVEYKTRGTGAVKAAAAEDRPASKNRRSGLGGNVAVGSAAGALAPPVVAALAADHGGGLGVGVPPVSTKMISETAVEITIPTLLIAHLTLSPTSGLITSVTLTPPPTPTSHSSLPRTGWPTMHTSILDRLKHAALASLLGRSLPQSLLWAASCAKLYTEPCCVCGTLLKIEQVREGALWQNAAKQSLIKQGKQQEWLLGSTAGEHGDEADVADKVPSIDAGVLAPPAIRWVEGVGPTAVHESCYRMAGQTEGASEVRPISI